MFLSSKSWFFGKQFKVRDPIETSPRHAFERSTSVATPDAIAENQKYSGAVRRIPIAAPTMPITNPCPASSARRLVRLTKTTSRVRRAATRRIKEMIDVVARYSPDNALVIVATMVGALMLAHAVDDPKLSEALREASRKHFDPTGT